MEKITRITKHPSDELEKFRLKFSKYVAPLINPLTFLFLWAILGFLAVTDIDRITKNWKHTKLILLFKST